MGCQSNDKMTAKKYAMAKQRIRKGQKRAKSIGVFYLLAIVLFALVAMLPIFSLVGLKVSAFALVKGTPVNVHFLLAISVINILVPIILVINVFKAFKRIDWLRRTKASKTYGFNRPIFAMDEIASIFNSSFSTLIIGSALVAFLMRDVSLGLMAYVVLGVGMLVHLICGWATCDIGLFDEDNDYLGQKREYGKFSCLLRNLLQIAACVLMIWPMVKTGVITDVLYAFYTKFNSYLAKPLTLIVPVLEILTVLLWMGMVKYAFSGVEYDIDGREAEGRKRFLVLALLAAAAMGGAVLYSQFGLGKVLPIEVVFIGDVAIGALVAELILIACPRRLKTTRIKEKTVDPENMNVEKYIQDNYQKIDD